ncbi:hypothetical protein JTZ10_16260 [Gordonia rubripertincta]|uniref:Uncharacterized protein n=1 Tax=Gordonia rubripertincta TaxID=36822 RepID=A0AAW4G7S2_GORRU|nr:hypothetical protein [Gordonia rubripertincta]MBM7279304.1 hypothetical protein [Gordonia rubripertincta]
MAEQQRRVEAYAIGYDAEEADFFREVEPRIKFGDVLKLLSREWECDKQDQTRFKHPVAAI